ncbi:hypothetical protein [Actinokineospora enzanensis]|uniref:hypothetical protein n=1 Tax=Actinokineospora enzanensis TaxID=155975 RepID=UPI0005262347|nr:hypothetical protein [Actinokineospora enzanensis]
MDARIAAHWADALDSGVFTQGTGRLKYSHDGTVFHCAWGVLCELAVQDRVIPPAVYIDAWECFEFDHSSVQPPKSVLDWAAVDYDEFGVPEGPVLSELVDLNDRDRRTFAELASVIRDRFVTAGTG